MEADSDAERDEEPLLLSGGKDGKVRLWRLRRVHEAEVSGGTAPASRLHLVSVGVMDAVIESKMAVNAGEAIHDPRPRELTCTSAFFFPPCSFAASGLGSILSFACVQIHNIFVHSIPILDECTWTRGPPCWRRFAGSPPTFGHVFGFHLQVA